MNLEKMKTIILSLGLPFLATVSVHAAPSTLLGAEWYVPAEDTIGGIALIDKSSGVARLGRVQMDATVQWTLVPTGISDVSDVASTGGGFHPHHLWVTSPQSNRVAMLNFGYTVGGMQRLSAMQGVGPVGVAEGADSQSIVVTSTSQGTPRGLLEIVENPLHTAAVTSSRLHTSNSLRLEPMTNPLSGQKVTVHGYRSNPNTLSISLLEKNGGSLSEDHLVTLPGNLSFITDVVGTTGERMIIAFQPGTNLLRQVVLSQPLSFKSTHTLRDQELLPFPVSTLIPVPTAGAGPMSDGVIAIAANGAQARWLRIDDLGNVSAEGPAFLPSEGQFLNGILPVSGIGVVLVEASALGGASHNFISMQWNGSKWIGADQGSLPALTHAPQLLSQASVLFYSSNPFIDENAYVVGTQAVPDWSSLSSYPDPYPSTVNQEEYGTTQIGLRRVTAAALLPPSATGYVMTNQVQPDLSVMLLQGASALAGTNLVIHPASGSYTEAQQIKALYPEQSYDLYYRSASSAPWSLWSGSIGIGYSSNWQFYLRNKSSGQTGEIISRSYQFAARDLATFDSDQDGVPDYVEMAKGLNPFGGADSDGDGVSDLDEILAGTDPLNGAVFPETPENIPTGDGLVVAAMPFNALNAQAATGEFLTMSSLAGTLLSRERIADPAPLLGGGITRYANLKSNMSVPASSLVLLSTPSFYNVLGNVRSGREIIRFQPADPPLPFTVATTPTGTNLANDAEAWILAAQSAALTYRPVSTLTELRPQDSAVAILLEEMIHSSLLSLRPVTEPLVPLEEFTAFSSRSHDAGRYHFSQEDFDLLRSGGYDHRRALTIAQNAATGMSLLANAVYHFHATNYVEPVTAESPVLPLPIDALRLSLRGQGLPASYAAAANHTSVSGAVAAYDAAKNMSSQVFRPVAQWLIEVPATAERGVYLRISDAQQIVLLRENGERFYLDQGLGLAAGTRFVVGGYTDTSPSATHPTMEVTTVVLTSASEASDRDEDGNLLDDEWERYFFGATAQDPQAIVKNSGYRLLQYFLDGVDPRGDDVPTGDPIIAAATDPRIAPRVSGGYTLDFRFPDAYASRFAFVMEASTSLEADSFSTMVGINATRMEENAYRFTIPASGATETRKFFRVRIRLR